MKDGSSEFIRLCFKSTASCFITQHTLLSFSLVFSLFLFSLPLYLLLILAKAAIVPFDPVADANDNPVIACLPMRRVTAHFVSFFPDEPSK